MTSGLDTAGYRLVADQNVWVRQDADDAPFAYNDGDAHENYVRDTVRAADDVSVLSRELPGSMIDWPSTYHLTSLRANIARPLVGTIEGPVLELGAGMGAVTRALGEAGLDVVAVEGSPRRASVCADRCRDLPNVQVVNDKIQDFSPGPVFGTVVMIGVLEYSRAFVAAEPGQDPIDAVLAHVASLLRPGGQLVVAIENQIGLKYLASVPEDHLARQMLGVEDRYRADGVVTFGRQELSRRLAGAGLVHQEWLFPFPDYKLPTVVVSERAFAEPAIDVAPLIARTALDPFQHADTLTFDLPRAWRVAARNGLVGDLANSFLVRASAAPLATSDTVAWHFGPASRRPEFAKVTAFERDGDRVVVRRRRLAPQLPETVDGVTITLEDEAYVAGRRWTDELEELVARDGWDLADLERWFRRWFDALAASTGLAEPTADAPLEPRWLDALPRNLVLGPDGPSFIDAEWQVASPVTVERVVFRAAHDSLRQLWHVAPPQPGTPVVIEDLVRHLAAAVGVVLDDDALARQWELERELQEVVQGVPVGTTWHDALAGSLDVRDRSEIERLRADLEVRTAEAAVARREALASLNALEAEVADLRCRLDAVTRSASWRVTRPLRGASRLARRALARLRPSAASAVPAPPDLDPAYYRARYADLQGHDDAALLQHWTTHGRAEGRRGRAAVPDADVHVRELRPDRATVVALVHDAAADARAATLARRVADEADVLAVVLTGAEPSADLQGVAAAWVAVDPAVLAGGGADDVADELTRRFAPARVVATAPAHPLAVALQQRGLAVTPA